MLPEQARPPKAATQRCRRYSPALSRRCTHLLAGPRAGGSRKLALARCNLASRRWATRVVLPAWLLDSAAAGVRLAEERYLLPANPAARGTPAARPAPAGALLLSTKVPHASASCEHVDTLLGGPRQVLFPPPRHMLCSWGQPASEAQPRCGVRQSASTAARQRAQRHSWLRMCEHQCGDIGFCILTGEACWWPQRRAGLAVSGKASSWAGVRRAAPRLSRFAPAALPYAGRRQANSDEGAACPAAGQRHDSAASGSLETAGAPGRAAQGACAGAALAVVAASRAYAGRLQGSDALAAPAALTGGAGRRQGSEAGAVPAAVPAGGVARQRGWALQGGQGGGVPGRAQRTPQAPWRTLGALSLAAKAGAAAGLPAAPALHVPASVDARTSGAAGSIARSLAAARDTRAAGLAAADRARAGGKENAVPPPRPALDQSGAAWSCPGRQGSPAAAPAPPREVVQQLAERLRAVRDRQGGRAGARAPAFHPAASACAPCAPAAAHPSALCPSAGPLVPAACTRRPHGLLQITCDPALPCSGPAVAASCASGMSAGSSARMAEQPSAAESADAGGSSESCRGSCGGHAGLPLTQPWPDTEPAGASAESATAGRLFHGLRAAVDARMAADASARHAK